MGHAIQYSVDHFNEQSLSSPTHDTGMEAHHQSTALMSPDPLRCLREDEISLLRECYRRGLPGTLAPFLFIDTHLRWCEKIRQSSTKAWTVSAIVWKRFFTLASSDREELTALGTFVAITEAEKCPTVVFWTQRDDLSPLKHALEKTAYISWKSDPAFSCVALDHYPMVQSVLQQNAPHLMFRNSTFFRLPRKTAKAMNVSVPDGYEMLALDESHAAEVNATWPHRFAGSEEYYCSLFRLNGGLALTERMQAGDGQKKHLAGWILTNEYGALAHLYIQPAHRQRGLASVLVKAWVTRWTEALEDEDVNAGGSEVIAYILDANTASRTLFTKLGFIEMSKSRWSNPTTN
uniref:N-acetyltransferase domain-containing protein n=1 Tax=Anopheles arabiensis TaxID=7173 RepID=A0A182I889_ANOAR